MDELYCGYMPLSACLLAIFIYTNMKRERGGDPNNLGHLIVHPMVHLAPTFVGKIL
jgi:hypothetical protein